MYDTDLNITWLANANANGAMNWTAANTWAAGLTVGGFTGWRLPTADPACGPNNNCVNSELGHLYYTELGVTQGNAITSSSASSYLALFTNVQNSIYWSGTEYAPGSGDAWLFSASNGFQNYFDKDGNFYAWAVRSGDVGSVPEPGVIGLFGIGALAWAGTWHKRRG